MADPIPVVGDLAVDFRTWAGADEQISFTVGGVTATALPSGTTLYQDATDGLGIRPGTEFDEVDNQEILKITIPGGMLLTGVWITDLFSGGSDPNESGQVSLNGGSAIIFYGANSDQVNGEQFVGFGGPLPVNLAVFSIYGSATNNEFSVAGFTAPEPGILILLGICMTSIIGLRRWWKD